MSELGQTEKNSLRANVFRVTPGQKFVVENAGGAGGTVGTLRAARAAADGYTILSGHVGTNALAPAFYPDLGYDPQRISNRSD
jgi:tripartite-type tricarboxylate transporter receptor subunit TctC